jgi:hypothetical protein
MDFKKVNNWTGWIVTLIACTVYIMTSEATGSFWDCGEFISSAYKLQIPHPPGAPMFVLLGRLFIILFGDNPLTAAKAVNIMSAVASGFTIMFLFWTITHFAKRLVQKGTEALSNSQIIAIMGAGVVGALAYTFSDSFWYSAVEGEVYALSSFFTALVFWAILKWEQKADEPGADKWIIFIFFMMGISVGVHLLNILTIPAIVMVYYFRNYKANFWGGLIAFVIGVIITGFVQVVLIQYTIKWSGAFDIIFVNDFHLPFFTGFATFFVLMAAVLSLGIYYANKKSYYFLKLGTWSIAFFMFGYTSYLTTMIRSNANPSVDMNNVDNPVTLVDYLSREQYGDWPILKGPNFNDPQKLDGSGDYVYAVDPADKYVKMNGRYEAITPASRKNDWTAYPSAHYFPRMYDEDNRNNSHDAYESFAGVEFKVVSDDNGNRRKVPIVENEITTRDNIKFFTNYQLGFMYLRYFLWNFAGKQNDIQGFGNARDGNFITGISFIDNFFNGDQSKMPDTAKSLNKANNKLFLLPLILGIIGFIFQLKRAKKDSIVTSLLFIFTGIAIVVYLNQQGLQPRERDYAYVGSFYAFAIWIGIGVLQVITWFNRFLNHKMAAIFATLVCLLAVPTLMAQQEWDDHDRSKKTLALDLARNYLESCPPNAILFTFGDNDTYPLWYAQEVEGIRPDVRVVVNSLLGSDWYMKELGYKVNQSGKFDVIFNDEQIAADRLEIAIYNEDVQKLLPNFDPYQFYNLDSVFRNFVANPQYKVKEYGRWCNVLPTLNFKTPIDKAGAIKAGIAKPSDNILDELMISLRTGGLSKNDLAMLAIISTTQFKRPVCFTSNQELNKLGIDKYIRLRGMSYELVPFEVQNPINTEVAYENVMKKFAFGNAKNPDVYFDEENRRHLSFMRLNIFQIAQGLINDGLIQLQQTGDSSLLVSNKKKASQVLRKFDSETNERNFPYGMTSNRGDNSHNRISYYFLQTCYDAGDTLLAKKVSASLLKDLNQQVDYYKSLGEEMNEQEVIKNLSYYFFEGNQEISEPEQIKKIKDQSKFSNSEYRSEHPHQIGLLSDWQSALYFKNEVEKLANPPKSETEEELAEARVKYKQLVDSIAEQKIKDSLKGKAAKKASKSNP